MVGLWQWRANPHAYTFNIITQRDIHLLRLFTDNGGQMPIGIACLTNINYNFATCTLWYVLGEKQCSGDRNTTWAVYKILILGFLNLGLEAVNAWVVGT